MDGFYYIKVITAFIFVVTLMYLIGRVVKRFGGQKISAIAAKKGGSSLHVVDNIILDYRRRLILVDYAGKGYMVMLGAQSETVVASGIELKEQDKAKDD